MRNQARRPTALVALGVLLLTCLVVGIMFGPVQLSSSAVLASLSRIITGEDPTGGHDALISAVRLPRVLVAAVVGAALALSGAAMQAVFRNPLAEPGITGVASGAAAVAVVMIITGAAAAAPWALPAGAFLGALTVVALVQVVGLGTRRGSTASLLLVGIALNAFLGAFINAVVVNASDAEDARSAMFWLSGDLTGRSMADVELIALPILIGSVVILLHSRDLNLLALGDATAQTSGMDVRRTKHIVLAAAALATAAGVAVTGIISFVGLVVPHLVRLIWGSDHRFLLPASALLGASFLLSADTTARLLFEPVTLQTGTVTAFAGAPFLLFLVLRGPRGAA